MPTKHPPRRPTLPRILPNPAIINDPELTRETMLADCRAPIAPPAPRAQATSGLSGTRTRRGAALVVLAALILGGAGCPPMDSVVERDVPGDDPPGTNGPEEPGTDDTGVHNVAILANSWKQVDIPPSVTGPLNSVVHGPFWAAIGQGFRLTYQERRTPNLPTEGFLQYALYSVDGEHWHTTGPLECDDEVESYGNIVPVYIEGHISFGIAASASRVFINVSQKVFRPLVASIPGRLPPEWDLDCEYNIPADRAPYQDPYVEGVHSHQHGVHWIPPLGLVMPGSRYIDRQRGLLYSADRPDWNIYSADMPGWTFVAYDETAWEMFVRSGGSEADWPFNRRDVLGNDPLVPSAIGGLEGFGQLYDISTWNGSFFIIVSPGGLSPLVLRTADGLTWTLHPHRGSCFLPTPGEPNSNDLNDDNWRLVSVTSPENQGRFLGVAIRSPYRGSTIESTRLCESSDGINWTRLSGSGAGATGAGAAGSLLVSDGDGRTVITSGIISKRGAPAEVGVLTIPTAPDATWYFTAMDQMVPERTELVDADWGVGGFVIVGSTGSTAGPSPVILRWDGG